MGTEICQDAGNQLTLVPFCFFQDRVLNLS